MQEQLQSRERDGVVKDILEEITHHKEPEVPQNP